MRCVEGVSRLWGEGFFVILGVQAWTLLECGVGGLESAFSSENLENLDTYIISKIVLLERLRPQPHAPSFLN